MSIWYRSPRLPSNTGVKHVTRVQIPTKMMSKSHFLRIQMSVMLAAAKVSTLSSWKAYISKTQGYGICSYKSWCTARDLRSQVLLKTSRTCKDLSQPTIRYLEKRLMKSASLLTTSATIFRTLISNYHRNQRRRSRELSWVTSQSSIERKSKTKSIFTATKKRHFSASTYSTFAKRRKWAIQ